MTSTDDAARNLDVSLAGRRVLIVEDEGMVSMFIEDTLVDLGCEVVGVASRFDQAMEKALSLSFDLAVLDVNLNGRQTFPIAEAIVARGSTVVFSTGYGASALPEPLCKMPMLQKPFEQAELERTLRAALAAGA